MKKLLLLTFALLLWSSGIAVAQEFVVDELKYSVTSEENHEVSVAAANSDISGDITIPSTVESDGIVYTVTSVASRAFENCGGITAVNIPESVTRIWHLAFWGCSGLTSITIPAAVTEIGEGAFVGLSKITEFNVSPENTEYCTFNKSIYSKDLTTIVQVPIGYDSDSYIIPESVTSIGYHAFGDCSNITTITVPGSVTSIGNGAFWYCSGLTSLEIPAGVTSLGSQVFWGCTSLKSITIPDGITEIGYGLFCSCESLTSITIPESVTSIATHAFATCSSLTSITIPENVTTIDESAFSNCENLTEIVVNPNNSTYCSVNKSLYTKDLTVLIQVPAGYESESYDIPNGVITIGWGAFDGCTNIKSIAIPEGVTSIHDQAFLNCNGITSFTLPESVVSVGELALASSNLSEIYSLNPIAPEAKRYSFGYDPTNIILYVPKGSVEAYAAAEGWSVFTDIREIGAVYEFVVGDLKFTITSKEDNEVSVGANSTEISGDITIPATVEFEGVEYKVTSLTTKAFNQCVELKSVVIPEGITAIPEEAFFNCYNMTSVTIPEGVSSIGKSAFTFCRAITILTIPESVKMIGEYGFFECYALSEVYSLNPEAPETQYGAFDGTPAETILYVPQGSVEAYASAEGWSPFKTIREIGAVYEFVVDDLKYSITSKENNEVSVGADSTEISGDITIPSTVEYEGVEYKVTSLSYRAFRECHELTSAVIPEGITSIAEEAFYDCYNMTSVSIPESVTSIGREAFTYCRGLTAISIPEFVISIGQSAFFGCGELKSITLPESVAIIGEYAFDGCGSLSEFYSLNPEAPEAHENSFGYLPETVILYVPEGSVEAYASAEGWSVFSDIREIGNVYEFELGDLKYTITSKENREVSVAANSTEISGEVIIPAIVEFEGVEYNVTSIIDRAFYNCYDVTSIKIPDGVTTIGEMAFEGCHNLASISIPEGVVSIGWAAFNYCSGMKEISVDANNQNYAAYDKSLYSKDMTELIKVPCGFEGPSYIIPDGVTSLGKNAFLGCGNLESVTIAESVTLIDDYAFALCSGLTSITLPEGVTSIGVYAFTGCWNLSKVYSLNPVTPEVQYGTAFDEVAPNAVLFVPEGCVEAYASAEGWSVFSDIREIKDEVYSLTFNVVGGGEPVEGAMVTVMGSEYFTDERGQVVISELEEMEGTSLAFTIYKDGYEVYKGEADFAESTEVVVDVELEAAEAVLTVKVFDGYDPLEGAMVTFEGKDYFSDETGTVKISGIYGPDAIGKTFPLSVYKDGYEPFDGVADFSETLDAYVIADMEASMATLQIKVMADGEPVEGAIVTFEGAEYLTDANGEVVITGINGPAVIGKTVPVTVIKDGYETFEGEADFTETLDAYVVATLTNIQTAIRELLRDLENSDIKVYDLNGRRVISPQNGQFYIINGQKVLLKKSTP